MLSLCTARMIDSLVEQLKRLVFEQLTPWVRSLDQVLTKS